MTYYLAQTHLDADSPQRTAALREAADAFNDVFERDRDRAAGGDELSETGLRAKMWRAKAVEELGDPDLAADLYDEVLVGDEKGPATGLEPLYAEAHYDRLLLLAKQNPRDFLPTATAWLQSYRRLKQTDGYQGVALEVAKALWAKAKRSVSAERAKLTADALQVLIEASKVRSQYQQEAILLKREILKAGGKSDLEAATFDEAVALGDAALRVKQWEQARDSYRQALAIAGQTRLKDAAAVAAVREAEAGAVLMMAQDLFRQGKFNECIAMTAAVTFADSQRKTVRKPSRAAAQASALAVGAALNLYDAAPDDQKPAALERLMELAKFTETNWPDSPAADDARIDRARAKAIIGQLRAAIEIFERVNPLSERYALAMYSAAQCYKNLYLMEKAKPEKARNAQQMAADRAAAIARLTAGLDERRRQFEPGKPAPPYFFEMQLLLAQLRMDANEMKEAAALFQPLVDIVKDERPEEFDQGTIAVFLGAVRAYLRWGNSTRPATWAIS